MAKREISIVLRAKNAMATGIAKAGAQLKKFGASAAKIGKMFAKGFLAAGAAVAAFGVKALQAYSIQEGAERQASAALEAHGEAIGANMAMLKKQASAIQDETGVADENILARMARLRMLGVETSALGDAARATIALKAAGMEEAAAIKAVAMARNGDFEMLRRYIPALRSATTDAEKAAITNDFVTKGYAQQEAQLDTVAGRWAALKGRVGDVWEEFGRAIAQSGQLKGALDAAGERVKAFGQSVTEWIAGGGVVNAIATFKGFLEEIRHRFNMVSNTANIAFSAIGDGFATVGKYLGGIADAAIGGIVAQFKGLAGVVSTSLEFIKNPSKEAFKAIGVAAKESLQAVGQTYINTAKAIATNTGIVSKRTEEALAQRAAYEEQHADRVQEISAQQTAALAANADSTVEAEKTASAKKLQVAESEAAERKKIDADRAASAKEIADLEKQIADKGAADRKKLLQDEIKEFGNKQKEKLKIANQTVQDMLDAQAAAGDKADEASAEGKKASRLQRKIDRGTTLGKKDQAFIDAFNKREEAKKAAGIADVNMKIAQDNLAQLQNDGKTMGELLAEMKIANTKQQKLDDKLTTLLTMA